DPGRPRGAARDRLGRIGRTGVASCKACPHPYPSPADGRGNREADLLSTSRRGDRRRGPRGRRPPRRRRHPARRPPPRPHPRPARAPRADTPTPPPPPHTTPPPPPP